MDRLTRADGTAENASVNAVGRALPSLTLAGHLVSTALAVAAGKASEQRRWLAGRPAFARLLAGGKSCGLPVTAKLRIRSPVTTDDFVGEWVALAGSPITTMVNQFCGLCLFSRRGTQGRLDSIQSRPLVFRGNQNSDQSRHQCYDHIRISKYACKCPDMKQIIDATILKLLGTGTPCIRCLEIVGRQPRGAATQPIDSHSPHVGNRNGNRSLRAFHRRSASGSPYLGPVVMFTQNPSSIRRRKSPAETNVTPAAERRSARRYVHRHPLAGEGHRFHGQPVAVVG